MTRKAVLFLLFLIVPAVLFTSCDPQGLTLQQQLIRTGTDPTHLLSIYAGLLGAMFVLTLVFGGRGILWAVVDSVCVVGLLSLVTSPIYWVTSGHWKVALGIGISGLLSLLGTAFLYWLYHMMPERRPLFSDEESEGRRQHNPEEDE